MKEAVSKKLVLCEDGNWLVGRPRSFCGGTSNKTGKQVQNPERSRVIKMFAVVFTSFVLKEDLHVKHFEEAATPEMCFGAVECFQRRSGFVFLSVAECGGGAGRLVTGEVKASWCSLCSNSDFVPRCCRERPAACWKCSRSSCCKTDSLPADLCLYTTALALRKKLLCGSLG